MCDLDTKIAEWRETMAAGGINSAAVLDELEGHLREDVERCVRLGLKTEQAFHKAVQNIGGAEKLEREFAKVRELKRLRMRHVLRRWSAIAGTSFVYCTLAVVWSVGVRQGTLRITWVEIVLALGAVIPMVGFGWLGQSLAKRFPACREGASLVVAIAVIVLSAVALRLFWNALTPATLVQTQIILLWSLSPLPGIGNCLSAWVDKNKCRELEISN